jgi:hypothetical protein
VAHRRVGCRLGLVLSGDDGGRRGALSCDLPLEPPQRGRCGRITIAETLDETDDEAVREPGPVEAVELRLADRGALVARQDEIGELVGLQARLAGGDRVLGEPP